MSTLIPIQSLDTTTSPPNDRSICAVITLLWPYSSSMRQCAALLSDPDFRLRARKGQVRVRFSGAAARAVAESRLGIGDVVHLDLTDAEWVEISGFVRTPGKSVGELHFARSLHLKVQKDGEQDAELRVEADAVNNEDAVRGGTTTSGATPVRQLSASNGLRSSFAGAPSGSVAVYSSPAFLRRSRLSTFESSETTYDGLERLFGDDPEAQQSPRKRARVSIGEVRDWRMISRTPSPVESTLGTEGLRKNTKNGSRSEEVEDIVVDQEDKSEMPSGSPSPISALVNPETVQEFSVPPLGPEHVSTILATNDPPTSQALSLTSASEQLAASAFETQQYLPPEPITSFMPPPPLPRLQMPSSPSTSGQEEEQDTEGPSTPHLQPISSAGLPLPSPFPVDTAFPEDMPSGTNVLEVPDHHAANVELSTITQMVPQRRAIKQVPGSHEESQEKSVISSPRRIPQALVVSEQPVEAPALENENSAQNSPMFGRSESEDYEISLQPAEAAMGDMISGSDTDDNMGGDDEDEDLREDDIEEEYDMDELEGEEPSDDDTGSGYESYLQTGEPQFEALELSREVEEVSDSESEVREEQSVPPAGLDPFTRRTPTGSFTPAAKPDSAGAMPIAQAQVSLSEPEKSERAAQPGKTASRTFSESSETGSTSQPDKTAMKTPVKRPASPIISGFSHTAPTSKRLPDFGMDGATPDPITPLASSRDNAQTTPLSAHDRVMKKTLQSLFGFRGSPSPTKDDVAVSEEANAGESLVNSGDVLAVHNEPKTEKLGDKSTVTISEEAAPFQAKSPTPKPVVSQPLQGIRPNTSPVLSERPLPPSSTQDQLTTDVIEVASSSEDEGDIEDDNDEEDEKKEDQGRREELSDTVTANLPVVRAGSQVQTKDKETAEIPTPPLAPTSEKGQHTQEAPQQSPEEPADSVFINAGPEEERRKSEHAIIDDESPVAEQPRRKASPLFSPDSATDEFTPRSKEADQSIILTSPPSESTNRDQGVGDHTMVNANNEALDEPGENESTHPSILLPEPKVEELLKAGNAATAPNNQAASATSSFHVLSSSPAAAPDRTVQPREDDVEMLDMSQTEPEPWSRASQAQSLFSQKVRKTVVDDSLNSAHTSIVPDSSSRPGSRDTVEDLSQATIATTDNPNVDDTDFANYVIASQELGSREELPAAEARSVTPKASKEVPRIGSSYEQQDSSVNLAQTRLQDTNQGYNISLGQSSPVQINAGTLDTTQQPQRNFPQDFSDEQKRDDELLDMIVNKQRQSSERLGQASPESKIRPTSSDGLSSDLEVGSPLHDKEQPFYPILPMSPSFSQPQTALSETRLPLLNDVQADLPPTPQLTQGRSDIESVPGKMEEGDTALAKSTSQPKELLENMLPLDHKEPPKTPNRKSLKARLSHVPDVISAWFSPKQSNTDILSIGDHHETGETKAEQPVDASQRHASGFSTAHSYYTSLASLEKHLNPSSQQVYSGSNTVDVLAVITGHTRAPERAKRGPRDYFTAFNIADQTLPRKSHVGVEVFRPWKAVLPAADVGDVVLLRSFLVKSRKRQPYLLSTDASAWCVWRFQGSRPTTAEGENNKPVLAHKRTSSDLREEVKGPPVEYSEAERAQVTKLREWWLAYRNELEAGAKEDGVQGDGSVESKVGVTP